MKLTKSTDFALRLVISLASREEVQTMPDLSEKLGIPYHNLTKLVQHLGKGGVLMTRQGKKGGVRLARPADEISLKNIIDIIDGPTELSDCLSHTSDCAVSGACQLKGAFRHIQSEINTLFESVKIAQVVQR